MEDTRDNEEDMRVHFKAGDKIRVKPFFSNHLLESYPASKWLTEERTVEALDEGASEGLDVYDVRLDDGSEESVYGVQVIANLSQQDKAFIVVMPQESPAR